MDFEIKRINDISEYEPTQKDTLFLTGNRETAEFLQSRNEAVCIRISDEKELSFFLGFKYFTMEENPDEGHLEKVYCHLKNIPYVIGEKDGITVREEIPDDLEKIYEMYDDPACRMFLDALPLRETVDAKSRFESVKNGYMLFGYGMWIIEKSDSGEVIGRAGFEYADEETVSFGFMIKESERGRGFAKTAGGICVDYLRKNLPDLKITAVYDKRNKASEKILNYLNISGNRK